ncbi:MAG: hypothetical protein AB1659_07330, partial [Thermodesulfobacteriota bacterium]
MKKLAKRISSIFAAGAFGGLINSLVVWIAGSKGIAAHFNVAIAPQLTPSWLYPRIIWGGLWGLLFFLPLLENKHVARGLVFSLGPSLAQLFF